MSPYAHKLLQRAEGIWHNSGLLLEKKDITENDGATKIILTFKDISPALAEYVTLQMSKAFRRANIYWKNEDRIRVFVSIPPM